MKTSAEAPVNIVCALMCEARPLIDFYRLKKRVDTPFVVFELESSPVRVVICGIGMTNAATAVGWVNGLAEQTAIWLNIGTAGHAALPIASALRVHSYATISQEPKFVPLLAPWPGQSSALLTAQEPSSDYPSTALVDMEGAGFFTAALHFTSAEFVQAIKIVSDNIEQGFEDLNPAKITTLVEQNIEKIVNHINALRGILKIHHAPQIELPPLPDSWTFSQQKLVRDAIQTLAVLGFSDHIRRLFDQGANSALEFNQIRSSLNELARTYVPALNAD